MVMIKAYPSLGKNFGVEVLACVIFRHTLDAKLDEQVLRLARHMTGDETIKINQLILAMQFCGNIIENGKASFLRKHKITFNKLNYRVKEANGINSERANAVEKFQKKVHRKTVHIHKPHGTQAADWQKFKAEASVTRLGSMRPGLYG